MYNGFGEFARFAAAEIYEDSHQKNRAISIVVSGGIVSAFIGPAIADYSNQYFSPVAPYFGPYIAAFLLCSLSAFCYYYLNNNQASSFDVENIPKIQVSNAEVLKNPVFIMATSTAAIAYLVMAAMMDAMPITMLDHQLNFSDTASVLQWHMLAMFAPSFLTAKAIEKYGVSPLILSGITLNVIGLMSALQGVELHHFWLGLFMIGLGWNFMYLGGTNLLTRIPVQYKSQAEGLSNLVIMSCFALSAPLAAYILIQFGWSMVSYFSLMLLLVAATMNFYFRKPVDRYSLIIKS